MRLSTLLLTAAAAAAGFAAARRLMGPPLDLDRLPEAARGPIEWARARLLRARARAAEALREGTAERDAAQRELMREYYHRSGRT